MKRAASWLTLALLGALGGAVRAGAAEPAVPPPAPAQEAPAALRNPFWPPGYTPGVTNRAPAAATAGNPAAARPPAVDARALARAQILVQGFVRRGAQSFAMINGQLTGVGDVIRIQSQGRTWRFAVRRIADQDVTIEPIP